MNSALAQARGEIAEVVQALYAHGRAWLAGAPRAFAEGQP